MSQMTAAAATTESKGTERGRYGLRRQRRGGRPRIEQMHGFFRYSFVWTTGGGGRCGGTDFGEFADDGRMSLITVWPGNRRLPRRLIRGRVVPSRLPPGAEGALDGGGAGDGRNRLAARDRTRDRARARAPNTPLVMVTAYDAPTARTVEGAGADMILVGDTLAMVVLGYDDTLQVTIDDMAHHVGAVARTNPHALVVGDLPWLSYHVSTEETVHNAARLDPRGRGRGEARRRPQAARRDPGDPRRRDPGDGPHRPDAAVDPRARRLQGAGQGARRRAHAHRRRGRARRRRMLRDRARVRARRRRAHDHRGRRRADDRHRRGPPLRRPGHRVARRARLRGPDAQGRSSCASTRRSKPTRRARSRSSATTCAPARTRRARRRTT